MAHAIACVSLYAYLILVMGLAFIRCGGRRALSGKDRREINEKKGRLRVALARVRNNAFRGPWGVVIFHAGLQYAQ